MGFQGEGLGEGGGEGSVSTTDRPILRARREQLCVPPLRAQPDAHDLEIFGRRAASSRLGSLPLGGLPLGGGHATPAAGAGMLQP